MTLVHYETKRKGCHYSIDDLKDVFIKQVRSVLELAVPVWNGALNQTDKKDLERVQNPALHIMLVLKICKKISCPS